MANNRGRPQDPEVQQERKDKLIAVAHRLMKQKSFQNITIRELAAEAGMQSAMISYYFGSKEGLFLAMLEELSVQHFSALNLVTKSDDPLKGFIVTMLGYLQENDALSRFIIDDIIGEAGMLGKRFIELFPMQMRAFLPTLIEQEQAAGRIRPELDPQWCAFSLLNMILMPFMAEPVRERAWDISRADICSDAWADHIYNVFTVGVSDPIDNSSKVK